MATGMYRAYSLNILRHWPQYVLGILALLITTISEVLIPKFIQWSVDLLAGKASAPQWIQGQTPSASLNLLVLLLLVSLSVGWLGRIGWRQLLARRTHDAGHRMKVQFWDSVRDQKLSFLHRYPLGDLMNRATGDWNKSRFIHGFSMVFSFDLLFFISLALISMLLIDPWLTIASLAITPFLPPFIIKLSRMEYAQHQKAQDQLSHLSDLISQSVQTVRMQRSTATEGAWLSRLAESASLYAQRQLEVLRIGWRIFIIGALPTLIAYGVLFSLGIWRYQTGHISIGEFLALQSYILLLQSPLFELGSAISEWQTGFASFARLHEVFQQKPQLPRLRQRTGLASSNYIEIKDLSFSYNTGRKILNQINLKIRSGEKIGITGQIGSGKSSLAHILGGLEKDYIGDVSIHGQNLKTMSSRTLSQLVSLVPQKPFLFSGSIRHNMNLNQEYSDETLIEALKAVRLWSDVEAMSDGLDTWIGEWGLNLSGGQKQRLAIARALIRNTPVLILDDSLSAVDSVTEEHILEQMNIRYRETIVIWMAHRNSTLQSCNRVFTLNDSQLTPVSLGGAHES